MANLWEDVLAEYEQDRLIDTAIRTAATPSRSKRPADPSQKPAKRQRTHQAHGSGVSESSFCVTESSRSSLFNGDRINEQNVRERSVADTSAAGSFGSADATDDSTPLSIDASEGQGAFRTTVEAGDDWLDEISSMPPPPAGAPRSGRTPLGADGARAPGSMQLPSVSRAAAGLPVSERAVALRRTADDESSCPVCRERVRSLYENNREMAESIDAVASGVKSTARAARAHSAIQKLATDRYKLIFDVESSLRGVLSDEQLIPHLLKLHRRTIEKELRFYNFAYTPWTAAILREHFDPRNQHVFDKVREIKMDLQSVREIMEIVKASITMPDPANPGRTIFNDRAVDKYEKLMARKQQLVTSLDKSISEKDHQLSGSVFALLSSVDRLDTEKIQTDALLRDPRTAAGTMAAGGDMRQSVNQKSGSAVGSAYSFYSISGY